MRLFHVVPVLLISQSACSALPEIPKPSAMMVNERILKPDSPWVCNEKATYVPVLPFQAPNYTEYTVVDGKDVEKIALFPKETEKINELLPNISTEVKYENTSGSGSLGAMFGGNASNERLVIDFIKYRLEPMQVLGDTYSWAVVGAGMRIKIDSDDAKGKLNVGILAMGAELNAQKVQGHITVNTMGINSTDLTSQMPFSTDVSSGSIQRIVEALAIVRSRLHDTKTNLVPQVIGKVICPK